MTKLFLLIVLSISLSACHTSNKQSDWPDNIPQRSIFIDAYEKQVSAGTNDTSLETHLKWIKRFYRGLSIYPGWNDMTNMVIESLADSPQSTQDEAKIRLAVLGKKIAIEWAQSNDKRNINSANINTWGNALRTSVKKQQQMSFLTLVEKDVDALKKSWMTFKQANSL